MPRRRRRPEGAERTRAGIVITLLAHYLPDSRLRSLDTEAIALIGGF